MKCKAKSMMSLNEMAELAIKYEGDGYVTGYPIVSGNDAYILNGVIEANEEYITINQWVPVFPESIETVSPSLTDDQQEVLEWLKKSCTSDDYTSPMLAIYKLYSSQQMAPLTVRLTKEQQYQVLAAVAEWGMEEVAE